MLESGSRLGEVISGKYRLVRFIGEGGMGEVYEAQHLVLGRRFALKFLHPSLPNGGDALARFRREAQAAGALESEYIASAIDFDFTDDSSPFLVMEYLAGESLANLLAREGVLSAPRAISIALQVCGGLQAAHAGGIIHRDLKPDNLFLIKRADGSELVKILDFGIAKLTRSDEIAEPVTRTGAMLGTPFYMAPEQARGEKSFDHRVDLYALGATLYEVLSGSKPHPGDSHNSILAHILTKAVVPLDSTRPGLPKGLSGLVHRALSSDPGARPASAVEFARELTAFAGREVPPIHSHFELRAAVGVAPTLPSSEASDALSGSAAPLSNTRLGESSNREQVKTAASSRVRWLTFTALGGAVVFAFWWRRPLSERAVEPLSAGRTAAFAAGAPAAVATGRELLRAAPANSFAAAPPASVAPLPSLSALGRPLASSVPRAAGHPNPRSATHVASEARAPEPSSVPAAIVQPGAPVTPGRRVTFDHNNPYE